MKKITSVLLTVCTKSFFEFLAPITDDLILSSVFGGVFVGAGVGLVFRSNATTGGTDIVVFLLKKYLFKSQ